LRGEATDIYTKTPNSNGYYHITKQYWANGVVSQLSGLPGVPTISYGVDGEGRWNTVSAGSGQNPVTQSSYNPAARVTSVTYGSGDSDTYQYDANTGRMTQYAFSVNSQSVIAKQTWNANGTLKTFQVTQDPFNPPNVQTCNYGYDDLARVSSAGCGSAWAQNFSYDAFGNISKTGNLSFQPTYNSANQYQSLPSTIPMGILRMTVFTVINGTPMVMSLSSAPPHVCPKVHPLRLRPSTLSATSLRSASRTG
jgi:hypothetical protein